MSEWNTFVFNDVLSIINGKNQRDVENKNGIYPIYGSGGIMGYANDFLCPENTVIIGRKGSINKPIFVEEKFWNVDTAFGLVAKKGILESKYLYYFCEHFDFEHLNRTVTIPSLTKADLLKIQIPLPTLEEQKRIAAILDKCTEIIAKRKAQLAALDELVKARFVEMFGDVIKNDKGWKVEILEKLATKIGSGATPRGGKESYSIEGISLIRSMNVHNGYFEYKDLAHISDEQAELLNNVTVEEKDVLLNITGASVARSCIVPKDILPARVNQHVCIIRCKDCLMADFLNRILIDDNYQNLLWSIAGSGATREAITKQQVENLQIIVPPVELQKEFSDFVAHVDKTRLAIQKSLEKTQLLFDSLMQKYFG